MDLLLATRNAHKTREFAEILGAEFRVSDLSGLANAPEINETGKTFEENAILKAIPVSKNLHGFVLADDSGLEVDALGGAPGIFSARYAGKEASDRENVERLLRDLQEAGFGQALRTARFRCLIALARDGKVMAISEGLIEGEIAHQPRGASGFGYDPIFIPAGYDKTFAEMSAKTKNELSHRARALHAMRERLRQVESA
jgi:XTP/dITP diphosphohydrolase